MPGRRWGDHDSLYMLLGTGLGRERERERERENGTHDAWVVEKMAKSKR